MLRKEMLLESIALAGAAGLTTATAGASAPACNAKGKTVPNRGKPLRPPANGIVNVALVAGPQLVAIDLIGPYTAFMSADFFAPGNLGFNVFTVAATSKELDLGGMFWRAAYTFDNAPRPDGLVVPQQQHLPATIDYIRRSAPETDVTMSVCSGAFLAAEAGLFDGGRATTYHSRYDQFAQSFPKVTLVRGARYVEDPDVSSSGGETSGMDLALRVVERYFGRDVANETAYSMEYRRTARPASVADV
jgi:transcriptional regulator GlxA family with amidase domain